MASFAAEFPIEPNRSVHDVMRLACRWITGSPHSGIKQLPHDGLPQDDESSVVLGREQVFLAHSVIDGGEMGGIRYERTEDTLAWTTNIVSLKSDNRHILRMEVNCEALTTLTHLPPSKKPYFIKQAITELGGGNDGEIPVADCPFLLSPGEEDAAASLILGTAGNSLPIIYVSAGFNGEYYVDPAELARFVGGLAHVVVEPNRKFSYALRRKTRSRNAFGGTVGVYWPDTEMRSIYAGEEGIREGRILAIKIAKDVRIALSNRRHRSNCTWAHLKEFSSKNRYEQLKSQGSTELNQYISAFDDEIAAKKQTISEREEEIASLSAEIRRLRGIAETSQGGLIERGDEQDFYRGEVRDIVISALRDAATRVRQGSRRAHILQSILDVNNPYGEIEKSADEVKSLLREYRSMDARTRAGLTRLGFELSEEGKHWKIVFQGDTRYTFTLPKTGGDFRGGLNTVSDINNILF
jgi:hypothetical protein